MPEEKPWNRTYGEGRALGHPALGRLLERGDPGTRPRRVVLGDQAFITYSSTRVNLRRDAWEMLEPGDLFMQWIRPKGERPWAMVMTPKELERVFGSVRATRSWEEARCYHFPQVPRAVQSFRAEIPGERP